MEALALSRVVASAATLRIAADMRKKKVEELNFNDRQVRRAIRNAPRDRPLHKQKSGEGFHTGLMLLSGGSTGRRDLAKAGRAGARGVAGGNRHGFSRSENFKRRIDFSVLLGPPRGRVDFAEAKSWNAVAGASGNGEEMMPMKTAATTEFKLNNADVREQRFPGMGWWPLFSWQSTRGQSFSSRHFGAEDRSWVLSGLGGLDEGILRELTVEGPLGRHVCTALATIIALFVWGAVVHAPSSGCAATLADLSSVTRIVELPPLPTEFPALRDISPLAYEKFLLPNGLRVFLLEDHELGLVGGELLLQGGGKGDPANKVGLAAVSAVVQRIGGSTAHSAEDLDSELDAMAARIDASSSVSETSVGFRCLTEDLPAVFSLFSEVVQEPLMPVNKLELSRAQYVGAIARRPDDAEGTAAREFNKLLYGNESVYSRVAELQTVKAITREDLLAFHKENFCPEKGVLGIWGDFDATAVKILVEQQFGNWIPAQLKDASFSASVTFSSTSESGYSTHSPAVYLINRPGLTQGYVRMGEFGTTLADPDVFALDVLNGILNGFGGLLFDEVRSREGLAYSVSGGWSPAVEHRGSFIAGGETRVEAIPQFVQAVKQVLEKVTSEPPNADLLAAAKEKALNSFVFNFADSGAQLARVLTYELFGIDQDFLFKYKEGVEATTAADVMRAAQRHLHPNLQPVLVVTDAQQLKPLLPAFSQQVIPLDSSDMSAQVQ